MIVGTISLFYMQRNLNRAVILPAGVGPLDLSAYFGVRFELNSTVIQDWAGNSLDRLLALIDQQALLIR